MKKVKELPIIEPLYSTYHNQGPCSAIIEKNQTITNWVLNNCMFLICTRRFMLGFTSPEINVYKTAWHENPFLEKIGIPMKFFKNHTISVITNLIDEGYYVHFGGIDDYYMKGKTWYKERHFYHDGLICGYNKSEKTFCVYAYDENWVYRKFWLPQTCFEEGRKAAFKNGVYGKIVAIKPKEDIVIDFSPKEVLSKLAKYNESTLEDYPEDVQGVVWGTVVHDYIAKYLSKLRDGSIPYEKMDRRVFRLIWEHKKVLLQIIKKIEETFNLNGEISGEYENIVEEADCLRMLYASYHMKRRDSLIPILEKRLMIIKEKEQKLLKSLLEITNWR